MPVPSPDKRTLSSALPSMANLSRVVNDQDEVGLLEGFGRYLSRFGFATRNVLMGDPLSAAKNLGQFGLDTLTLGFMPDITTREERPEFTDLLKYHQVNNPFGNSDLGKFGADLLGGMLTDPLTFVSGAGAGSKLAGSALAGLGRAGQSASVVKKIGTAIKGSQAGRAALKRGKSAEDIWRDVTGSALRTKPLGDTAESLAEHEEYLDEGLEALVRSGYMRRQGSLHLSIPFTNIATEDLPRAFDLLSPGNLLRGATIPGLAHKYFPNTMPIKQAGQGVA